MIVCITEKPAVANDIATLVGASTRRDGFYEGNGYIVTWTYGHLCCLKEPGDYTEYWKRWSLGVLPMIPQRFGIKVIGEPRIERQFKVIEHLVGQATEIINCGDAGQEGELIQRWVMQKAGVKCPVKRLWTSSLTNEALRDGFAHLEPEAKYDSLYYAGLSRAIGDWLLGMNATRLYSLKYGSPGNVLSVGRVQTPTLALVVARHHEIANFVPTDTWELRTRYRDTVFTAEGDRFDDEAKAKAVAESIATENFTVDAITQKKGRESAPRLFDLTSLQVECNKKWGWSADETLRLIQTLYEKKVTTYPRVDTTYLSEDLYPKIPEILRKMTPYAPQTAPVLASSITKSKKIFDNAKVTDHHAIIPTGQSPATLVGNERKLYHLIALRFIAAFYPDCEFLTTTVTGHAGKVKFKVSGKVIVKPGWRDLYAKSDDKSEQADNDEKSARDDDNSNGLLPVFTKGESGPHVPEVVKRTSRPPKYYTEGDLLKAMETAGRNVDDEVLREALKENGIGRPATRASIIETLFKRRYIYRQKKNIMASEAGIQLIATIKDELLKSAKLTGLWENKLRRIERGDYLAAEFIQELKTMVTEIVHSVMADQSRVHIETDQLNEKISTSTATKAPAKKSTAKSTTAKAPKPRTPRPKIESFEQIVCPVCGKGTVLKGRAAFGCSAFRDGCDFRVNFTEVTPEISPADLAKYINKQFKKKK